MKNIIAIFFFYVLITLCILAFLSVQAVSPAARNKVHTANITFRIITTAENTFGYNIFLNDKRQIVQPGVNNKGFKSKAEAEKIAQSVIERLKKGEIQSGDLRLADRMLLP